MVKEYYVLSAECDRRACREKDRVEDDRGWAECNEKLYARGWRLYRGKALCPTHARAVEKRRLAATEGK